MNESKDAPSQQAKTNASELLESLSKATVVALFATYVLGFLVVSIHNAEYGFAEISPLKPKILAAGTLFLALTLVPIASARQLFFHKLVLGPKQSYARAIAAALTYFFGCILLAGALSSLYELPLNKSPLRQNRPWPWMQTVIFVFLFVLLTWYMEYAWKSYQKKPGRVAVFGSLLLLAWISLYAVSASKSVAAGVALWLFGVGALGVTTERSIREPAYQWWKLIFPVVLSLAIFAPVFYPRIKSSWGGGSPTPVTVYFSHDSRILPGQQLEADLLDESESGVYVAKRGDKQAIFIPRSAVAAIYFSDKPLSPEFLNQPAKKP